jgi:uncharacterized protein YndB with AHSA1/START domain
MMLTAASPILALSARRVLRATPERVFRAWTRPEELKRWFAPGPEYSIPIAEVDLRVGGRYRLGMLAPGRPQASIATGTYEEITPYSRLVFTWRWEEAPAEAASTLVTVEFRPHGSGTEMVLTHEGFSDSQERDEHGTGWEGCLGLLAGYLD